MRVRTRIFYVTSDVPAIVKKVGLFWAKKNRDRILELIDLQISTGFLS